MQRGLWITADGVRQEVVPANGKKFTLEELQKYVGGYIEMTKTYDGRTMWVNEEGLLRNLPINLVATFLIHPAYMHDGIRGDVLIIHKNSRGRASK